MRAARLDALSVRQLVDIYDYRDREGRAIGEHRASSAVREGMPMVLKQCPYPDSRFKHERPMNVSALKQLSTHWDDILGGISFIRHHYLQRHGLQSVERTYDCLAIGEAIACIPSYIVYRSDVAVEDGCIDPLVGGLYKVIIGVNRVCSVLLCGDLMSVGRATAIMPSPDDIAMLADVGGFLIGREQVCGGSPRQISLTIEAVVRGGPPSPPRSPVQALLEPEDDFFAFAEGMRRLEAGKFLFRAVATLALVKLATAFDRESAKKPVLARELRSHVAALIMQMDVGTIQHFASTRSPDQIDRLIQGWFELAGGERGQPLLRPDDPDLRDWADHLSRTLAEAPISRVHSDAFLAAVCEQVHILLHLERRMQAVVEEAERRANRALGRTDPEPSVRPRRLSGEFGVTLLDRLGTELGVKLYPQLT